MVATLCLWRVARVEGDWGLGREFQLVNDVRFTVMTFILSCFRVDAVSRHEVRPRQ